MDNPRTHSACAHYDADHQTCTYKPPGSQPQWMKPAGIRLYPWLSPDADASGCETYEARKEQD